MADKSAGNFIQVRRLEVFNQLELYVLYHSPLTAMIYFCSYSNVSIYCFFEKNLMLLRYYDWRMSKYLLLALAVI